MLREMQERCLVWPSAHRNTFICVGYAYENLLLASALNEGVPLLKIEVPSSQSPLTEQMHTPINGVSMQPTIRVMGARLIA